MTTLTIKSTTDYITPISSQVNTNELEIITPTTADITGEPVERKITLRDVVVAELQVGVQRSRDLQQKINEAKTKPKRDLYLKKIRKNNEHVAELLLALQKLDYNQKIANEKREQSIKQDDNKLA